MVLVPGRSIRRVGEGTYAVYKGGTIRYDPESNSYVRYGRSGQRLRAYSPQKFRTMTKQSGRMEAGIQYRRSEARAKERALARVAGKKVDVSVQPREVKYIRRETAEKQYSALQLRALREQREEVARQRQLRHIYHKEGDRETIVTEQGPTTIYESGRVDTGIGGGLLSQAMARQTIGRIRESKEEAVKHLRTEAKYVVESQKGWKERAKEKDTHLFGYTGGVFRVWPVQKRVLEFLPKFKKWYGKKSEEYHKKIDPMITRQRESKTGELIQKKITKAEVFVVPKYKKSAVYMGARWKGFLTEKRIRKAEEVPERFFAKVIGLHERAYEKKPETYERIHKKSIEQYRKESIVAKEFTKGTVGGTLYGIRDKPVKTAAFLAASYGITAFVAPSLGVVGAKAVQKFPIHRILRGGLKAAAL